MPHMLHRKAFKLEQIEFESRTLIDLVSSIPFYCVRFGSVVHGSKRENRVASDQGGGIRDDVKLGEALAIRHRIFVAQYVGIWPIFIESDCFKCDKLA
ncbi:hypothetical protein PanWU01x14_305210 [Parasponia andersonii]|uniref:Uncharacterized protein n=1 Tax=Parasponia andersonii TaxID=3476 RepID=A0A2P5AS99_PARAD|nr:hypothetical protein PanWU01x14_305210 [Parasponia andersonii]